ncbi:MAG: hypothetical protein HC810_01475, partial [Acaryochloridaceae cyanobacterium RL_2_7]|nr:hypothetical protein [Acaryochloridaceae cyanobacterium RL_2_7]
MPLTFGSTQVQAESWKDWVQSNPTYDTPTSVSPNKPQPQESTVPSTSNSQPPVASPYPESPTSAQPPNTSEYFSTQNPVFVQEFLTSCQGNGIPMSYCQCTLKEVQNNYTFEEVMTIIKFMQNNRD